MTDDVLPLLTAHEYFRGLPPDALAAVARDARVAHHPAGAVVHEADAALDAVGFVLLGRLKAVRVDARGAESLFRVIDRGEQYGMMIGALADPVPIRVVALEPSSVLELDYARAMDLTARFPDVRWAWLKTFAGSLRTHFFGTARRRAPTLLALVHESPATRAAASRLVDRLRGLGERLAVFGDPDTWRPPPDVPFRALRENGTPLDAAAVRRQTADWQDATRIVFDVGADREAGRLGQLMEVADRAVFFAPASGAAAAVARLRALDVPGRGWRDKVRVAWLLGDGPPVGPEADLHDLAARDFKLADPPPGHPYGRVPEGGLERLVHDLRGVRVGVALGGGGARGMAHLGVLKALERAGVVVDVIAGASAGAMVGVAVASGLDCDYAAARFAADLRPSWVFRHLPRGDQWYLLYKYRRGQFDPMLRKYLRDWRLEQLAVPCRTVTVDLIGGRSVVRDRGDAVHAVLESINLPVLSVPICRGGQALVDGGLMNNIPADVLVREGCNFVIAVSVTAKMDRAFGGLTPDRPAPRRRPSVVQTVLRSLLVQNHGLNALGVQPADVVIAPDVTGFGLTEFTRVREMAAVGEAAALESVPQIRQLLHRVDPQLFPTQLVPVV